jgi:cytochrome c biogenesis protein CcdA
LTSEPTFCILAISRVNSSISSSSSHIINLLSCFNSFTIIEFLEDLNKKYSLQYYYIDLAKSEKNQKEYFMQQQRLDTYTQSVPFIVFRDNYWTGFKPGYNDEIKKALANSGVIKVQNDEINQKDSKSGLINNIFFNEKEIINKSPLFATIIIGFIDGFNPCSLWVLTILLGFLVHYKSRKKMIIIGSVFLITTATVYGLFIAGVLSTFNLFKYMNEFSLVLGIFILLFSFINLKDYFYFKKGISATISDENKNMLITKMRRLITNQNNIFVSAGFTILIALLAALIELPCTSGFPVIWSNIMTENGLTQKANIYIPLILLYIFVYLLDELIVFILATIKLRVGKMKLQTGKNLKLITGFIMFWIGLDILFGTNISSSITGLLVILSFSGISYFIIKKY